MGITWYGRVKYIPAPLLARSQPLIRLLQDSVWRSGPESKTLSPPQPRQTPCAQNTPWWWGTRRPVTNVRGRPKLAMLASLHPTAANWTCAPSPSLWRIPRGAAPLLQVSAFRLAAQSALKQKDAAVYHCLKSFCDGEGTPSAYVRLFCTTPAGSAGGFMPICFEMLGGQTS